VLALHTDQAAKVLGLEAGSIAPGNLADLVLLRDNSPSPLLPENVIYHLTVGALGTDVSHVIVDGTIVVADGKLQTVDEEAAHLRAAQTVSKLWQQAVAR
jgi:5-methylthioadenosine/S-adenosylhomocysteine deaminase